jgi:hypothetical protein
MNRSLNIVLAVLIMAILGLTLWGSLFGGYETVKNKVSDLYKNLIDYDYDLELADSELVLDGSLGQSYEGDLSLGNSEFLQEDISSDRSLELSYEDKSISSSEPAYKTVEAESSSVKLDYNLVADSITEYNYLAWLIDSLGKNSGTVLALVNDKLILFSLEDDEYLESIELSSINLTSDEMAELKTGYYFSCAEEAYLMLESLMH